MTNDQITTLGELRQILGQLRSWEICDPREDRVGWVEFSFTKGLPSARCLPEEPRSGWTRNGNFHISDGGVARALIAQTIGGFRIQLVLYYRWKEKNFGMPEVLFVETGDVDMSSVYRLGLQPHEQPIREFPYRSRFVFYSWGELPGVIDRVGIARHNYLARL